MTPEVVAAGFQDPDAAGTVDGLVGYLDAATAVERILEGKRARAALVLPVPGLSVLDVGCGTGDSLRLLAERARPGGRVVGVDTSASLLAVGRQRAEAEGWSAEWVHADAAALPFDDGEFDASLAERVLQHVEDPAAVVGEMRRVTRPGGTVVLAEPDWGALRLDAGAPGIAERVAAAAAGERVRHPHVGIRLRRLLADAGLGDLVLDAEVHISADPALVRPLALLDEAVSDLARTGELDPRDLEAWQASLDAEAARGHFTASFTLFVARGRVPTP
jgi:SAM-dependent methyltransferase